MEAKVMPTRIEKGMLGERAVYMHLRNLGFMSVRKDRGHGPFDLLVDGQAVEVKYALPSKAGFWQFNIQRRGKMPADRIDACILCMDGVPYCSRMIYLVIPEADIQPVFMVSYRSLLGKYRKYVENWGVLHSGTYPLKPTFMCNESLEYCDTRMSRGVRINPEDYGTYAKVRLAGSGLEMGEFADSLGISLEDVQDILDGNLNPSTKALTALGISTTDRGDSQHVA